MIPGVAHHCISPVNNVYAIIACNIGWTLATNVLHLHKEKTYEHTTVCQDAEFVMTCSANSFVITCSANSFEPLLLPKGKSTGLK